jgi:hypothetical protein
MDTSVLLDQAGIAVAVVHGLELVKSWTKIPWLNEHSDQLNRMVSFAVALLTSIGISIAVSGDAHTGGVITITVPSAAAIFTTVIHALAQGGIQQTYYHLAVKK